MLLYSRSDIFEDSIEDKIIKIYNKAEYCLVKLLRNISTY